MHRRYGSIKLTMQAETMQNKLIINRKKDGCSVKSKNLSKH